MPIPIARERWEEIFKREYTILFEVAKSLLKNKEDAEDIVQEAIRSLLTSREIAIELRGRTFEEAVRLYLLGVIRNHIANHWRERYRHPEVEQLTDDLPGGPNPEEQEVLVSEVAKRLSAGLKRLFTFLVRHIEVKPDEHWVLWAEQNGLDPKNHLHRNSHFDQPKRRLRKKLLDLGVFKLPTGKG